MGTTILKFGSKITLAATLAFAALSVFEGALFANKAGERRIAFYNIHTKDTVDVVYKRNGRRIPEAMDKINWVLRDWRQDEKIDMDPELIDILWEMHTELGSREPIHVISGYRSPKTNEMLRKTRGGQAKKSQHMLGHAADVHFPDVPIKRLRYSAMIRERGGVGYYPTSTIPFVHVDTARVRHWPRMPRPELALLFPNGKTQHRPPDNKPITIADVRAAKAQNTKLAMELSDFHSFRRSPRAPRPTLVASNTFTPRDQARAPTPWGETRVSRASGPADVTPPSRDSGPAAPASRPASPGLQVAALDPGTASGLRWNASPRPAPRPVTEAAQSTPPPAPQLAAPPRLAARPADPPSQLRSPADAKDRERLTDLFTLASFFPTTGFSLSSLFGGDDNDKPAPVTGADAGDRPRIGVAALDDALREGDDDAARSQQPFEFIAAPAFDEEHPEELHYRPFPVAPLLTASASHDDPALTMMVAPDPAATIAMLEEDPTALPMRFTPKKDLAVALWADQFTGEAVNFGFASGQAYAAPDSANPSDGRLASRAVRTTEKPGRM